MVILPNGHKVIDRKHFTGCYTGIYNFAYLIVLLVRLVSTR